VPRLPAPGTAAKLIQDGSDIDVARLWSDVRQSSDDVRPLLEQLARHGDPVVRGWALSAIGETIGASGIDIIVAAAKRDRDSDVRAIAIDQMLELDLEAARNLAPMFRRGLRSRDIYEPVRAMWALAAIGDTGSIGAIRAFADSATTIGFHKKVAAVVCMFLEGRSAEILAEIRGHNHDLMPWLTRAARLLGTTDALSALANCAGSAFDEECRSYCQREADDLARRRARQRPP
jgi:hypothetical protein